MLDKKEAVLAAATKSFSTFGYKATSMDQVSKMAKVGKGTIYTFFTNKEELFDYIVLETVNKMIASAEASIKDEKDFFAKVHVAILNILDFRQKEELPIQLLEEVTVSGTPEAKKALQKIDREAEAFIEKHLIDAMKKGEIVEADPSILSFLLYKLYMSLVVDWKKDHEKLSNDKIASIFNQVVQRGLKNKI